MSAPIVWEAGQQLGDALKGVITSEAGAGAGLIGPSYMGPGDNDFRDGALGNVFSNSNKTKTKTGRPRPQDNPTAADRERNARSADKFKNKVRKDKTQDADATMQSDRKTQDRHKHDLRRSVGPTQDVIDDWSD